MACTEGLSCLLKGSQTQIELAGMPGFHTHAQKIAFTHRRYGLQRVPPLVNKPGRIPALLRQVSAQCFPCSLQKHFTPPHGGLARNFTWGMARNFFSLAEGKQTCQGQFHPATPRPAIHRFPPSPSEPPIPLQPALGALDRCSVHLSLPLFQVQRPRPSHRGSGGSEAGEGKPGALLRPLEEERKAQH